MRFHCAVQHTTLNLRQSAKTLDAFKGHILNKLGRVSNCLLKTSKKKLAKFTLF